MQAKRLIKFSIMRLCDCVAGSPLVKLGDGGAKLIAGRREPTGTMSFSNWLFWSTKVF